MGNHRSNTAVSADALLKQHRDITEVISELDDALSQYRGDGAVGPCRTLLRASLGGLTDSLRAHFDAEKESVGRDFDDAPRLQRELMALDEQHPHILAAFEEVQRHLDEGASDEQLCSQLARAIARFREHEALEDVLFTSC